MIIAAKIQVKELESKRGTTSLRRDHFFSEAACHRKLQLFGYHMTQNEVTADTKTSMEYTRSTVNILPPSLQKYPYQHDCPVTISTDTSAVRCSVNSAMDTVFVYRSIYLTVYTLFGDNELQRSMRDTFSNVNGGPTSHNQP